MNTTTGLIMHITITIIICAGIILTRRDRMHMIGAGLVLILFGLFILITGIYPGRSISYVTGYYKLISGFVCIVAGGILFLVKPKNV